MSGWVTTLQTIWGLCTSRHCKSHASTSALHTPKYSSDLPVQDTTATRRRDSPAWLCGRQHGPMMLLGETGGPACAQHTQNTRRQAHDRRLDRFWCFQTRLGHTKTEAASRPHAANEMPRPQDRATRMRSAASRCVTTPWTIWGLCTSRHRRSHANTSALHTPKHSSDLPVQDTTATRRRDSPAWVCGRRHGPMMLLGETGGAACA